MFRALVGLSAVVFFAPAACASGSPMDQARSDAWHASHIVVADATGKVLEVWKGDLKVGDVLPVDEKVWRLALPQVIRHNGVAEAAVEGKKVHADRVILFLKKAGPNRPDLIKPGEWVGLRPFFVSAGKDGVFAQVYVMENGVQPVYVVAKSEAAFKAEYLPIAEHRTALDAAVAEPDVKRRAERLRPFVTGAGRPEAFEALAGCGEAGVAPLAAALFRKDWGDNKFTASYTRDAAIKALVKIGKPAAAELVKFLDLQRVFWELVGPTLGPNWNDGYSPVTSDQLRHLFAALADPEVFADVPAERRAVLRDLHDLWTKTPPLAGLKTVGDLHPAKLLKPVLDGWETK